MQSISGATLRETVKVEPHDEGSFGYRVEIGGEVVRVEKVRRLRDGGTTILYLVDGSEIVFPHRIGSEDRVPTLDDEPIFESKKSS